MLNYTISDKSDKLLEEALGCGNQFLLKKIQAKTELLKVQAMVNQAEAMADGAKAAALQADAMDRQVKALENIGDILKTFLNGRA